MKLINIARALYSLAKVDDLQSLYQFFMKSKHLSPYKNILSPTEIIKVVFLAYEIAHKRNPEALLPQLNNLYIFSIILFGDNENWVNCEYCAGDGNVNCGDCYGTGYVDCDECDSGKVTCDTCDGYGGLEDNETCPDCGGRGNNKCEHCDGEGEIECEYCYGTGQNDCPDCNGEGEIETDEYVPFDVVLYASYDKNLRTSIERSMVRNEEFLTTPKWNKTFYLTIKSEKAGEGDTDMVDQKFTKTEYINGIDETDNLVLINERIIDNDLLEIHPKFLN